MAAFNYKFKTVKKVKEQLKKKTEKKLADVELEILSIQQLIEELTNELKDAINNFSAKNVKVSELQFHKSNEKILNDKIKSAEILLYQLKKKKSEVMAELEQKSKEHKIFDILEDNMRERFNTEQNKLENIKIDEIAVQKFARGKL